MTQREWDELFRGCPGAWLGNAPCGPTDSHITVDPTQVDAARAYLRQHRNVVRLTRERPSPREGVQLWLRDAAWLRARAREAAADRRDVRRATGLVQTRSGQWE